MKLIRFWTLYIPELFLVLDSLYQPILDPMVSYTLVMSQVCLGYALTSLFSLNIYDNFWLKNHKSKNLIFQ